MPAPTEHPAERLIREWREATAASLCPFVTHPAPNLTFRQFEALQSMLAYTPAPPGLEAAGPCQSVFLSSINGESHRQCQLQSGHTGDHVVRFANGVSAYWPEQAAAVDPKAMPCLVKPDACGRCGKVHDWCGCRAEMPVDPDAWCAHCKRRDFPQKGSAT